MEYAIPPIIIILVLRFAIPGLITLFFVRFVEPTVEEAKAKSQTPALTPELSNTQKIATTRQELDILKQRLAKD